MNERIKEHDELVALGYRQCAVGQRTTQWCAGAEKARERDEALLKQALEALEGVLDKYGEPLDLLSISGGLYECLQSRDAITALRERLAATNALP